MKKIGTYILIFGLICLIGPLFGFTFRGMQNAGTVGSMAVGLIATIVGFIIYDSASNDNKQKQISNTSTNINEDNNIFECCECGKLVEEGVEKCPYCGTKFDWDNNDEQNEETDYKIIYQDKDNIVYSDDYYWDYCNNIDSLDTKMKKTVFDFVTGLYKTIDEKAKTFIKYNDIHNYNDYYNSMKMFVYCISSIAKEQDEKYNNMILTITKYYVKYYTKYILKYGDIDDKAYLSKAINLLKSANIGTNEDEEELVVYSDKYYLDYANSIQPLGKEAEDKIFNLIEEIGKTMKIKAPIKQYSSINTRQEYLDSASCVNTFIEIYVEMKDVEKTTLFVIYFVKYYTKIILKYGTDEDKLFLSKHIKYLQELNIGKK